MSTSHSNSNSGSSSSSLSLLIFTLCFVMVILPTQVYGGIPVPVDPTIQTQLLNKLVDYGVYFNASDYTTLTNKLYTSDCQYIPAGPNIGIQYGRSAVAAWLYLLATGVGTMNFSVIETGADNATPTLIYQIGFYSFYSWSHNLIDSGKMVLLWEDQTVNDWKIYVNIYNSDQQW